MIHDMTTRFKDQVETLVKTGVAANYSEIANMIDWNKTSMSLVMKGKRNVPVDVYRKFSEVYNIKKPEPKEEPDLKDKVIRLLEDKIETNLAEQKQCILMNQALLLTLREAVAAIMARIDHLPAADKNTLFEVAHKLDKETSVHFDSLIQKGR